MLTQQQMADVRRYAGYPMVGDIVLGDGTDLARGYVAPGIYQTLQRRLTTMNPAEEARVVLYLTTLADLETDIIGARENLDTDQAAVWVHNKNEIGDRMRLYKIWRRELCSFLGVVAGPGLGDGTISMTRA
ncbi:hypothetical protein OKW98_18455 [Pseudomonas sp. KU26590]|uniref:hypothetical protein n=1 Tax=Pseudomonas sp. KU26590 TaxID=2991051 RepID=UPI00223CDE71|nr:hypothetical protein [Pseudomonas sp. KU26590]UZJ58560.1 hypothetical protein OKW98_18455 [Pseudomonas sp. KU26590]